MASTSSERCPGCGQGYLYTIGHTGEGEMRWCFMCSRGFSVPDSGELPPAPIGPDHGATIVQPTPGQAAGAQATTDPEQAASNVGNAGAVAPTTLSREGGQSTQGTTTTDGGDQ